MGCAHGMSGRYKLGVGTESQMDRNPKRVGGRNNKMSDGSDNQRTFEHAMLREIYEQPAVLAETIRRYVPEGKLSQKPLAHFRRRSAASRGW